MFVPLPLPQKMEEFLKGAHDIDCHFRDAPFQDNIPVLMGLIRWVPTLGVQACVGCTG